MSEKSYLEWQKLCDEFEVIQKIYFEKFLTVRNGFKAVADDTGGNPSDQSLNEWDKAWRDFEDIQERMKKFVEQNT